VTQALTIKDSTDISALRTQVLLVCSMRDLYRRMLSLEGSEAQRWLDSLQTVRTFACILPVPMRY
jgi:hypothetical protein